MKNILILVVVAFLFSCESTNPVENNVQLKQFDKNDKRTSAERILDEKKPVVSEKTLENGIKIKWLEHGKGSKLISGEVYQLNYKLSLSNGKVLDGNHKLRRTMLPYLFGFQMQTPGWDLAMAELNEGDFAEIIIPGKFAYGKKGIPGLIPPNAENVLRLKIGTRLQPEIIQGVKVWTLQKAADKTESVKEKSIVSFHYFVGTKSNPKYDNSYKKNAPFTIGMKDRALVPGLALGLANRSMFDKLWILVPASQAYGSRGMANLVAPNEDIFYDIVIVDIDGKSAALEANEKP